MLIHRPKIKVLRPPQVFLVWVLCASPVLSGEAAQASDYVGRERCIPCHAQQDRLWRGSHHDLAMQEASAETVLGDFNDAEFEQFGVVSRFFRKDGRFVVHTEGPHGKRHEFPIRYTFGVSPLQQYLVEFPGGRLQALDIAWDSRPRGQGGKRWFALHPAEPIRPGDPLHWTGPNLNWNHMCADCHSTHVRKNYNAGAERYHTTWSEIDVSCEACHGPGLQHLRWAEARARGDAPDQPGMGLSVHLDERTGISWDLNGETGKPQRSAPRETRREIQVCARCHARRSQLSDAADPGQPFLDGYRPALLSTGLYHPDGQIEDEVYVWGSFLQSRMYQAGVTCSDCHDPHSGELRLPGDQVCKQCHQSERYATKTHHYHPVDSTGASCVACHMPPVIYMQVDPRHDHSIRIPRPDLSVALGTPNACTGCHRDRDPQWAATQLKTWYGHPPQGLQKYAPALHAARRQLPEARTLLQALAGDSGQPGIARATALASLGAYPGRRTLALLERGLKAEDPLQRLGALDALEAMGQRERLMALPLLRDELRAVRIEAARLLAPFPPGRLPEAQRAQLERAIQEYMAVQRFNADRPESHFNLGGLYADQKEYTKAEAAYLKALELQPGFVPGYVNLAQLLSRQGREGEGEAWLRRGLRQVPDNADLYHALGLSLVRQKRTEQAMQALRRATELEPDNARYAYVYGVALNSTGGVDDALALLGAVHERHPGNTEVLYALATINRDAHHPAAARRYAERLLEIEPDNAGFARLVSELGRPAE